jgi:hypothetical protein
MPSFEIVYILLYHQQERGFSYHQRGFFCQGLGWFLFVCFTLHATGVQVVQRFKGT